MTATANTAPRRNARIWLNGLLVLLALAAIVTLRKAEPSYKEKLAPMPVPGARDQRLQARNFAVKAGSVKVARAYLVDGGYARPGPRRVATSGVWLSVLAETEALQEPGYVSAQLRDRFGAIYPASENDRPKVAGIHLQGRALSVGLPEKGAYFFEVPPDRLQGLHLQLFWGTLTPPSLDSLVDVDLGIDAATERKLLAKAPAELDLRP